MARKIHSRLVVTGTLFAQSPIHVGGMDGDPQVDLALAINGQGQYYIPGTSLAGALRGWMEMSSNGNREVIKKLWGFEQENGREGHASFVLVEDAPIEKKIMEVRDGVGIDRFSGTAAEQVKYNRAILPKGSKIPLKITVDINDTSEGYKSDFAALVRALENGEIRLGAAKTRGLGRVKLNNCSIREHKFSDRTGMLKMLRGKSDIQNLDALLNGHQVSIQRPQLTIEIKWQPQNSLMVKAEGDGIAVDILPLVSGIDGSLTFVLPGSSIKGALRTQAERIVRTVTNHNSTLTSDFISQLEVPLVKDLFGAAAKTQQKQQQGKIGSVFIDDCYANIPITSSAWAKIESATDGKSLRQALDDDEANLKNTQQAFHVAVDRWTGGAADSFLYSNLEPMGVTWQPIGLTVELNRLKEDQRLPGIALLLLVLRDLASDRIPLGYGTNRGMGSIKVTNVALKGSHLDESIAALENVTLTDGNIATLNRELLNCLTKAWKNWIEQCIREEK